MENQTALQNLLYAIHRLDLAEVKVFLTQGMDVNQKSRTSLRIEQSTPIYEAIVSCIKILQTVSLPLRTSIQILELLLQAHANPNTKHNGFPMLHYAIYPNPNKKVVKLLLQYGANPNLQSDDGDTVLPQIFATMQNLQEAMPKQTTNTVMPSRYSNNLSYDNARYCLQQVLLWGTNPTIQNQLGRSATVYFHFEEMVQGIQTRIDRTARAYNLLKNDGKTDLAALRDFYALTFDEKMGWILIGKLPLPKELKDIINSCLFFPTLEKYTLTDLHWKPSHLRDSPRSLQTQHATKPRF